MYSLINAAAGITSGSLRDSQILHPQCQSTHLSIGISLGTVGAAREKLQDRLKFPPGEFLCQLIKCFVVKQAGVKFTLSQVSPLIQTSLLSHLCSSMRSCWNTQGTHV